MKVKAHSMSDWAKRLKIQSVIVKIVGDCRSPSNPFCDSHQVSLVKMQIRSAHSSAWNLSMYTDNKLQSLTTASRPDASFLQLSVLQVHWLLLALTSGHAPFCLWVPVQAVPSVPAAGILLREDFPDHTIQVASPCVSPYLHILLMAFWALTAICLASSCPISPTKMSAHWAQRSYLPRLLGNVCWGALVHGCLPFPYVWRWRHWWFFCSKLFFQKCLFRDQPSKVLECLPPEQSGVLHVQYNEAARFKAWRLLQGGQGKDDKRRPL